MEKKELEKKESDKEMELEKFYIRTDLALEVKESFEGTHVEVEGVSLEKWKIPDKDMEISKVKIMTEEGAKAMRKPMGNYITMEAPNLSVPDEDYHREVSEELAKCIKQLLPKKDKLSVLVAGLGNKDVTPDALGPKTVENLNITRHIIQEYGEENVGDIQIRVSGIVPGVMAQTGMETAEIIKGIVEEIHPDVLIVIDSLAARSTKRLNTTLQISDTGIHPGSGVGNHRGGITEETMGIPVIAIGVPTVVDAPTIVNDAMDSLLEVLAKEPKLEGISKEIKDFSIQEKYQLIRELIEPHLGVMFVTPKDMDETIKMLSFTLSEGINMAFC